MQRILTAFVLIAAAAASLLSAYTILGQRRISDRLRQVEQTLAQHRESDDQRDETRRQDNRWINLLLRAQESPWVETQDAPMQCRLTVEADQLRASDPVRLLAEIRNASDQEQTVGGVLLEPWTLTLTHNGKVAKYLGPWKSMSPPASDTLPPGRIMRATVTLTPGEFAELNSPGAFTVEWVYFSDPDPPKITWAGKLAAAKVQWQAK